MTEQTDQLDTRDRVLTRRRIEQLRAAGLFARPITRKWFQHLGPLADLDEMLDENVPARADMIDGPTETALAGLWGVVMVHVEPDWHVTERNGRWIVWEHCGHPWDGGDLNIIGCRRSWRAGISSC
jgi:hypothetical protein